MQVDRRRWSSGPGPARAMYGPQAAFITELFPTRIRYSGVSIAYQLTSIVAGSLAPIIALVAVQGTWLGEHRSGACLVGDQRAAAERGRSWRDPLLARLGAAECSAVGRNRPRELVVRRWIAEMRGCGCRSADHRGADARVRTRCDEAVAAGAVPSLRARVTRRRTRRATPSAPRRTPPGCSARHR